MHQSVALPRGAVEARGGAKWWRGGDDYVSVQW